MKLHINLFIQSFARFLCAVLEFILFFPANVLILLHLITSACAITTFLYRVLDSREFWSSYLMFNFYATVTCAVLGFLFFILTDYVSFWKKPVNALKTKIKVCNILRNVIGITTLISAFVAMLMWGSTGHQLFSGDPWWIFVGRGQLISGAIWLISRVLLQMGYENILKMRKNSTQ